LKCIFNNIKGEHLTDKIPPLASKQLEPLLTPITDIKPHPENYKTHPADQIKSLRASVKAFGVTAPIKVNLEGEIVAGHGMYQLYIEDGYTHVPVIVEALDKRLSKAYLVADNETQRKGITEQDKLNDLLQEISEIPDFDIESVGFSLENLDSILEGGPKEVIEDDFNPDGEVETRCKEGDLWQLGRHLLLNGDSTKKEDVLKLLNGAKIDLLLTDPPYGVSIVTGKDKDVGKIGAGGPLGFGKIGKGNIVTTKTYKKIKGDETTDTAEKAYKVAYEIGIKNMFIWGGNYFTAFLPPSMGG
jgi:hypothetical protein